MGLPPATSKRDTVRASNKIAAMKKNTNSLRRPTSAVQSMANSPSLGPAPSPHHPLETTSEPLIEDAKAQRAKAIRTPLIHFLAVRPVSKNYLVHTLNCDEKDCMEVLERVGRPYRLDPDKWDLSDKAFKELDVWQFDYKTADDRQLAIDRAISSFDRSRLARTHPLWQKLLPFHERGKGKVLSNLNLKDPSQRGATPRIHVQPTDESTAARKTPSNDNDTRQDRLAPSDAESKARPNSSDPLKKTKRVGGSVRSIIPKTKEPKKAGQTIKPKEKSQTTTVRKAGNKKGATSVVAKSSEFVHDSDEEDEEEMLDAPAKGKSSTPTVSSTRTKESPVVKLASSAQIKTLDVSEKRKVEASRLPKVNKQPVTPFIKAAEKRPPMSSPSGSGSKQATSDSSSSALKSLPRQRTTSSPHKPSPLGSSPPTNASDLDNDSRPTSSTSSTPLIGQSQAPRSNSAMEKKDSVASGPNHGTAAIGRPLKRKAPADHDDTDNNDSGAARTNGITLTNGHPTTAKRFKASPISPPTSESSTESSIEAKRRLALEQAQRFKTFWGKYQRLYMEVSVLPKDTPNRKFDELMKMHERLTVMKAEISRVASQQGRLS